MKKKRIMSLVALLTAVSMTSATVFAAGPAGNVENVSVNARTADQGWHEDSNGWWYLDEYGEYPRDCIRYIHGDKYLFDKNGYMKTGWYYRDTGDYDTGWYYFKDSGEMAEGERVIIDGNTYAFNYVGFMVENTVFNGSYYNAYGILDKNQGWKEGNYGKWYYVDEYGEADHTGWKEIDGNQYYFDSFDHDIRCNNEMDGYFLSSSGAADMTPGWKQGYYEAYNDEGEIHNVYWWAYAGENGKLLTGWQKIGNEQYYFDEQDYKMSTGAEDGYYLNSNGCLDTSYGWKNNNGTWYFVGSDGKLVQGWKQINGISYYFDPYMYTDTAVDGKYYVNSSGEWDTSKGWKPFRVNFVGDSETVEYSWYYVDDNGCVPEGGWKKIDGVYYYFRGGYVYTNCIVDGCYLNGSGAWDTTPGWKHYTTACLDEWRYVDNNGVAVVENWKKIDGYYYYFGMYGEMQIRGVYEGCFVNSYGQWDTTPGWKYNGYSWYYVKDNGYVVTDSWKVINGKYYHFSYNGALDTDTVIDDCYVDDDGIWRQ